MIDQVRIQNFKGHRDTTVRLGRFTVLVGDNASGKTSVLQALQLQSVVRSNPSIYDSTGPDLLTRGSDGQLSVESEGHDIAGRWVSRTVWNRSISSFSSADAERAGSAKVYRVRAENVAAAAYSDDPAARVGIDGTNAAVALAALKLGSDEIFERIEAAMRRLIPTIERVRIRPATVMRESDNVVGSKIYFDFRGAPGISADGASHGTLLVLSLLTILFSPNRPNVILLDDFDHALHPRAQMELVRMIKELLTLAEFKDLQIVATTHSPYTLDELDPSDVQAFALRDDGSVASKRLSEHPEAERMKGSLTAGQLWSLDPERNWVLKE